MRTANPALNAKTFERAGALTIPGEAMTLEGTVTKSALLILLLLLPATWMWGKIYTTPDPSAVMPWVMVGVLGGLVVAVVTVFKQAWAPVTAPIYAMLQGLVLGGFSAIFEVQFPGIVIQAVALTIGTFLCLLMAYRSGLIQATENFKLGVVAATGAIALVYLSSIVLSLFGIAVPFLHDSGPIGIGISLFIVTIAALNLVLDFDFIEQGVQSGAPRYMEWYAAFGLLVTLVWLYLEILRLLAKLRSRD